MGRQNSLLTGRDFQQNQAWGGSATDWFGDEREVGRIKRPQPQKGCKIKKRGQRLRPCISVKLMHWKGGKKGKQKLHCIMGSPPAAWACSKKTTGSYMRKGICHSALHFSFWNWEPQEVYASVVQGKINKPKPGAVDPTPSQACYCSLGNLSQWKGESSWCQTINQTGNHPDY